MVGSIGMFNGMNDSIEMVVFDSAISTIVEEITIRNIWLIS